MKGFEVGKRVRSKQDLHTIAGNVVLAKGSVVLITDIHECACGVVALSWGDKGPSRHIKCDYEFPNNETYYDLRFFEVIEDDEIKIKSDTFKQVTFTKIIENVPSGVN